MSVIGKKNFETLVVWLLCEFIQISRGVWTTAGHLNCIICYKSFLKSGTALCGHTYGPMSPGCTAGGKVCPSNDILKQ